jgi:integrase
MTRRVRGLLEDLRTTATGSGAILPTADVSHSLATAARKAGIGHVHIHQLRHTMATRLRDRGVPLDRIMEIMGHRSYALVLRYAKARPQQLVDAIRNLDDDTSSASTVVVSVRRLPVCIIFNVLLPV